MGLNSKIIVTGDVSQIDLPSSQRSGLIDALNVLRNVKGIAKVEFDVKDIVRHKLVQKIVEAYEASDEKRREQKALKEKEEAEA
jgi:phosphate starvation-inducible PhoH-like protein